MTIPLPLVPLIVSPRAIVALTAIAALTLIHIRGLGPGRLVQNVLAGLKVGGTVVMVALGFAIGRGMPRTIASRDAVPVPGMLLALVPVMFSYSGWNAATYVAEEVRDPARTCRSRSAMGTGAVILLYVALNALYLYALPIAELAALPGGRLIDLVAERLFGFAAGNLLAVFTIVSLARASARWCWPVRGSTTRWRVTACSFARAASVHPRFRTPARRSWRRASGAGARPLGYAVAARELHRICRRALLGVGVASLFVLRRREPDAARPFKAWGYPWAPGLFVLASFAMVVNEIIRNGLPALAGLAIIALGIPGRITSSPGRNRVRRSGKHPATVSLQGCRARELIASGELRSSPL